MKMFTLHFVDGQASELLLEREALGCLYDADDRTELLDLAVGEGFKDADGDQWERTA